MVEAFFYIGLPYIALFVAIAGTIHRYRTNPFGFSSLSSQFLENRQLLWGSMPWHIGILVLLVGHLIPVLLPGVWQSLTANQSFLVGVEAFGFTAAILSIVGLCALAIRRLTSARLQTVTTRVDLVVLALLLSQILLGLSVAAGNRWGAVWSAQTTTPYLWSLITFRPNPEFIAGLPPTVRLHLVLAWFILLMVPFSRLVHLFSFPLTYLWRPPIKVVWTNPRRFEHLAPTLKHAEESRRYFLRGALGIGAAGMLLSVGVLDKLGRFFRGPELTPEQASELLEKKLGRLQMTAQERHLELERMNSRFIFVARLGELSAKDGTYFTDYQMRPALAFRDETGMPLLISAKCTHLGCTVSKSLDSSGRLLCPCHISYFDVRTGEPNAGSPAKTPLPLLGWALMDPAGNLVATKSPSGELQSHADLAAIETCSVYIAKEHEEVAG